MCNKWKCKQFFRKDIALKVLFSAIPPFSMNLRPIKKCGAISVNTILIQYAVYARVSLVGTLSGHTER